METGETQQPLRFDGDNSYPDCACCGHCCELNVLAITPAELAAMHRYIDEHGVVPINRAGTCCPLRSNEGTCMVWEARPQVCRLFNCHAPRVEVLSQNPDIEVPDQLPLLNLHEEFVSGGSGYASVQLALMRGAEEETERTQAIIKRQTAALNELSEQLEYALVQNAKLAASQRQERQQRVYLTEVIAAKGKETSHDAGASAPGANATGASAPRANAGYRHHHGKRVRHAGDGTVHEATRRVRHFLRSEGGKRA